MAQVFGAAHSPGLAHKAPAAFPPRGVDVSCLLHFFRQACFFFLLQPCCLAFCLHFFWHDLASTSAGLSSAVMPIPATAAATAERSTPRREASSLRDRAKRSNEKLSIASFQIWATNVRHLTLRDPARP